MNTAYLAWSLEFDLCWLSDPHAEHSRNLRDNRTAALAVYDPASRGASRIEGSNSSAPVESSGVRSLETPNGPTRLVSRRTNPAS